MYIFLEKIIITIIMEDQPAPSLEDTVGTNLNGVIYNLADASSSSSSLDSIRNKPRKVILVEDEKENTQDDFDSETNEEQVFYSTENESIQATSKEENNDAATGTESQAGQAHVEIQNTPNNVYVMLPVSVTSEEEFGDEKMESGESVQGSIKEVATLHETTENMTTNKDTMSHIVTSITDMGKLILFIS